MTHHNQSHQNKNQSLDIDNELVKIMSKILNKSEKEIIKSAHLFNKMEMVVQNALYSLSKMDNNQKINAKLSLEYLLSYDKGIEDLIKS